MTETISLQLRANRRLIWKVVRLVFVIVCIVSHDMYSAYSSSVVYQSFRKGMGCNNALAFRVLVKSLSYLGNRGAAVEMRLKLKFSPLFIHFPLPFPLLSTCPLNTFIDPS